jgi:hypothetical protein
MAEPEDKNPDLSARLERMLDAESEISFEEAAAVMRALTRGRRHTPAEQLLREGRDER